jgi:hypothetical protein
MKGLTTSPDKKTKYGKEVDAQLTESLIKGSSSMNRSNSSSENGCSSSPSQHLGHPSESPLVRHPLVMKQGKQGIQTLGQYRLRYLRQAKKLVKNYSVSIIDNSASNSLTYKTAALKSADKSLKELEPLSQLHAKATEAHVENLLKDRPSRKISLIKLHNSEMILE